MTGSDVEDSDPPDRRGGCLCGAVRYRITAPPLTLYACHCTDCQRLSASAFALAMLVPLAAIALQAGEPGHYRADLSGGRVRQGRACSACGTRLWGLSQRRPELAVVYAGSLDDTSRLRPVAHLWTRSAQPWIVFGPEVPAYDTQPEDPSVLVTLWQNALRREMDE